MITADTNVFVYLHDEGEPEKQRMAGEVVSLLLARAAPIGLQVVGEYQNALRRKLKLPPDLALQNAERLFGVFDTFAPSRAAAAEALGLARAGRSSYWDGLLVSAAKRAGCTVLLSEDMKPGAGLGIEIINPFTVEGAAATRRALAA